MQYDAPAKHNVYEEGLVIHRFHLIERAVSGGGGRSVRYPAREVLHKTSPVDIAGGGDMFGRGDFRHGTGLLCEPAYAADAIGMHAGAGAAACSRSVSEPG